MIPVTFYDSLGQRTLPVVNVNQEDEDYFIANDIHISMEELKGEFIVYACPYSDEDEESELIEFAGGRSCEDTLASLANDCKKKFGDCR